MKGWRYHNFKVVARVCWGKGMLTISGPQTFGDGRRAWDVRLTALVSKRLTHWLISNGKVEFVQKIDCAAIELLTDWIAICADALFYYEMTPSQYNDHTGHVQQALNNWWTHHKWSDWQIYPLWPLPLPPHQRKPHIPKLVGKRLKTRENSTALSPPQMDKARLCKILPMLAESFQEIKASTASPENIQCFGQGGQGLDLLERFCQHRQNLAQTQHLANANRTRHVCLLVLRVSTDVCRSIVPVNKRALSGPQPG